MAESKGLPWIMRVVLKPSEKSLDEKEQRRIGRQWWALGLIGLYNGFA